MARSPEFRVHSIAFGPEGTDLIRQIEDNWDLNGKLALVQIRCSSKHTREHLGLVANVAFGIRPLKPEEIFEDYSRPTDEDRAFAAQFGFTLIPRLAHLSLADDGAIEAWISPALVSNNHDLASKETYLLHGPSPRVRFSIGEVVRGLNKLTIARYIRLTVDNTHSVLGAVLDAIAQKGAEEEINVHVCSQPEVAKESPSARVAAFLNPCSGPGLRKALDAVRALPSCRSIDAVLPVVGLGRYDILPNS